MGLTDPGFPVSRHGDAELRHQLHAIIERALALLDALDGDPDLEPGTDCEPDDEDCCAVADDDPVPNPARQPHILYGAGDPEDAEATLQPVTLAPDWLRTKNERRGVKVRHGDAPQSSRQIGELKVSHGETPLQAFRAPGEPLPSRPAEMPVPPPANFPPGFDSDGNPIEPKRRSGKDCHSPLATGLRNACLAGTGFWVLVGLAGWGLLA
ncbi:hypothetical protein [Roseomonas mucosa]|nr:hypothetical protein [Roseomonas mucosa]MDT8277591.1 hypothetical protein [Roseomonas mucosa]MDT8354459.1 hypothetical protein [Roseomonas mucosa]